MSTPTLINCSRGVRDLDELGEVTRKHRSDGLRVAHCHGVFDLLHIGHIRHLKEARRQADVLVVTITPDRFVNKGPHRPAFTEGLRAEALASLRCIDYVAINHWPTAIETIALLSPDLYVKGPDYRDEGGDITGGITKERAAVEAIGGRIYYTDDLTFSSSTLLNRFFSSFSPEVQAYLASIAERRQEVLKLLSMPGEELPVIWTADGVEYKDHSAPYLSKHGMNQVTVSLPADSDPELVSFVATASAYFSMGSTLSRSALHKFIDHLLK